MIYFINRSFLITTAFFWMGCVAFSPKYNGEAVSASPSTESCKVTPIHVTFNEELNSEFYLSSRSVTDPYQVQSGIPHESRAIIERLKQGPFRINPSDSDPPTYYIHFNTRVNLYRNSFQRVWMWMSDLTALLLPSWTSGDLFVIAVITNRSGETIETIESSHVDFNHFQGLIFAPWNFTGYELIDLEMKYTPYLADEIIAQMVKKKLVCMP